MHRHYRRLDPRLDPDLRADHVEALMLLGRLVTTLPTIRYVQRSFVVMTIAGH